MGRSGWRVGLVHRLSLLAGSDAPRERRRFVGVEAARFDWGRARPAAGLLPDLVSVDRGRAGHTPVGRGPAGNGAPTEVTLRLDTDLRARIDIRLLGRLRLFGVEIAVRTCRPHARPPRRAVPPPAHRSRNETYDEEE
jgi:hypothetical protein